MEGKPIYFLEGANIGLRPLEETDLEGNWFNWFNDPEVTRYLSRGAFPNTKALQRRFYEENIANSANQVIFAIEDKMTRKHIGVASIRHVDWINRSGDIAVIIGEKEFRVGNNALEAFYLIVKHAFLTLNLNRLQTFTMASNRVSLEYCKRIGFVDIGVARKACYKNGLYEDCIYADLLRDEWIKSEGLDRGINEKRDERIYA